MIRFSTILSFLIGSRRAILRIAQNPWSLLIGALLVLSAGFARNYDTQDLRTEPWRLLAPYGASLLTSFAIYLVAWLFLKRSNPQVRFARTYVQFLGLYWFTAPLAWLYAIPYERWLDPVGAMQANLFTLGVVSLWRVILATRALSVLANRGFLATLGVIFLPIDLIVFTLAYYTSAQFIQIMGGIRLDPTERVLVHTADLVGNSACFSQLLWLIITARITIQSKKLAAANAPETSHAEQQPPSLPASADSQRVRAPLAALAFALLSVLIWIPLLPAPQRAQHLRAQVARLMDDSPAEGFKLMSAHARSDFPPHWRPPPDPPHRDPSAALGHLRTALETHQPDWVINAYTDSVRDAFQFGWVGIFFHCGEASENLAWVVEQVPDLRDPARRFFRRPLPADDRCPALIARINTALFPDAPVPTSMPDWSEEFR